MRKTLGFGRNPMLIDMGPAPKIAARWAFFDVMVGWVVQHRALLGV